MGYHLISLKKSKCKMNLYPVLVEFSEETVYQPPRNVKIIIQSISSTSKCYVTKRNKITFTICKDFHSNTICNGKEWKPSDCPSNQAWVNKMWYNQKQNINTMVIKRSMVTWMNPESMPREISQR